MAKVSKGTQFNSPDLSKPDLLTRGSTKRETTYDKPMFYDYVDIESSMDLDKLQTWCQAHWVITIRAALMNRNRILYHSCCNSFSRRHFIKQANHPEDETFNLLKLRDFKNIETAEDFYRWQLNITKENTRNGFKTYFPSINTKHYHDEVDAFTGKQDQDNKGMLRKRLTDLEQEMDEKKRLISYVQNENARLLRSSKTWHSKYEELLEICYPSNELLATPVKKNVNNWMVLLEDN